MSTRSTIRPSDLAASLRVPPGPVDLATRPTDDAPGLDGDKAPGTSLLAGLAEPLSDLRERLLAESASETSRRAVLLVLQGMDASQKGGVVRHTWFRNLAVGHLLLDQLQRMAPQWPSADVDVDEQRGRLLAEEA